jgi:hypothetical protein
MDTWNMMINRKSVGRVQSTGKGKEKKIISLEFTVIIMCKFFIMSYFATQYILFDV